MAKDFEVAIDCGGGLLVEYVIAEQELLESRDPQIAAIAHGEHGRASLASAAYQRLYLMVVKNVEEPISIRQDDGVVTIPVHAIRYVRLRDPEASASKPLVGFTMRDSEQIGSEDKAP